MPNLPDPKHLAEELIGCADTAQPIDPFSVRYGPLSPAQAVAIRQASLEMRLASGRKLIGKKIGKIQRLWSGHTQVHDARWGYILDSNLLADSTSLPIANLIDPSVEAEFAFLLARDLDGPGVTAAHALAAVEGVFPAFEIVDSRFRPKAPTQEDAAADNSSHAYAVVGPNLFSPRGLDLSAIHARIEINGETKAEGTGAKIAGHPANALAALANGQPLRAGEIILTGAVAGPSPFRAGDALRGIFDVLGSVNLQIE